MSITRVFRMTVHSIADADALIVVNALVASVEAQRPARQAIGLVDEAGERAYRNVDGMVVQCSHCRRVRYAAEPGRWDWVPAWVHISPSNTSHGLCGPCLAYHYSDPRPPREGGGRG